jgi:hypothetical protein
MSIRNWIDEKITSLRVGVPVRIANEGKPIDIITIRYKDFYFFIDIDSEYGEPTGGFGWSEDPTMNPTVPIRDMWVASPLKEKS